MTNPTTNAATGHFLARKERGLNLPNFDPTQPPFDFTTPKGQKSQDRQATVDLKKLVSFGDFNLSELGIDESLLVDLNPLNQTCFNAIVGFKALDESLNEHLLNDEIKDFMTNSLDPLTRDTIEAESPGGYKVTLDNKGVYLVTVVTPVVIASKTWRNSRPKKDCEYEPNYGELGLITARLNGRYMSAYKAVSRTCDISDLFPGRLVNLSYVVICSDDPMSFTKEVAMVNKEHLLGPDIARDHPDFTNFTYFQQDRLDSVDEAGLILYEENEDLYDPIADLVKEYRNDDQMKTESQIAVKLHKLSCDIQRTLSGLIQLFIVVAKNNGKLVLGTEFPQQPDLKNMESNQTVCSANIIKLITMAVLEDAAVAMATNQEFPATAVYNRLETLEMMPDLFKKISDNSGFVLALKAANLSEFRTKYEQALEPFHGETDNPTESLLRLARISAETYRANSFILTSKIAVLDGMKRIIRMIKKVTMTRNKIDWKEETVTDTVHTLAGGVESGKYNVMPARHQGLVALVLNLLLNPVLELVDLSAHLLHESADNSAGAIFVNATQSARYSIPLSITSTTSTLCSMVEVVLGLDMWHTDCGLSSAFLLDSLEERKIRAIGHNITQNASMRGGVRRVLEDAIRSNQLRWPDINKDSFSSFGAGKSTADEIERMLVSLINRRVGKARFGTGAAPRTMDKTYFSENYKEEKEEAIPNWLDESFFVTQVILVTNLETNKAIGFIKTLAQLFNTGKEDEETIAKFTGEIQKMNPTVDYYVTVNGKRKKTEDNKIPVHSANRAFNERLDFEPSMIKTRADMEGYIGLINKAIEALHYLRTLGNESALIASCMVNNMLHYKPRLEAKAKIYPVTSAINYAFNISHAKTLRLATLRRDQIGVAKTKPEVEDSGNSPFRQNTT